MYQTRDDVIGLQRNKQLTISAKLNGRSGGSESTERVMPIIVTLSDVSLAVIEDRPHLLSVRLNVKKKR